MSLAPAPRVEVIRQRSQAYAVPEAVAQMVGRDSLGGVVLCVSCTQAVRRAAAGLRKKLGVCATCKAAMRARCLPDRRGP